MPVLLLADHGGGTLKDAAARALTCAAGLGGPVHLLVAGSQSGQVAAAASRLAGVEKVLLADSPAFTHPLAETLADLVVALAPGYSAIVAAATSTGKNVLPRVAAMLDVMQVSEVTGIVAPDTFERPIYAGNVIQTVTSADHIKVITVRTASYVAAAQRDDAAPIESVACAPESGLSSFEDEQINKSDRPELTSAKAVVSGGRALGSQERFDQLIVPLADALGAATGASRAAVDAGYAPNDWQVGQTGKVVAPDLYVAVGISGAIQHLAGMKDAKVVVAINKDEEAPIFQVADYGLVADLFAAVPELTEAIRAAKAARS